MAKVKEISAKHAISIEVNGVWYKFANSIALELEPNDDPAVVKDKAWNTVITECEKQLGKLQDELSGHW